MASEKLTDLGAIPLLSAADSIYVVDASDTTDDAAGSSKKITAASLGARYLIEEITLGSAGDFNFTSIPSGFNRLRIKGIVRSDVTATEDIVMCLLNNDTTASNYFAHRMVIIGETMADNEYSNDSRIASVSAASSPANYYSSLDVSIEQYAGSHVKIVKCQYETARTASQLDSGFYVMRWASTAAITQVQVKTDNDPTDQLLGTLRLYGEF